MNLAIERLREHVKILESDFALFKSILTKYVDVKSHVDHVQQTAQKDLAKEFERSSEKCQKAQVRKYEASKEKDLNPFIEDTTSKSRKSSPGPTTKTKQYINNNYNKSNNYKKTQARNFNNYSSSVKMNNNTINNNNAKPNKPSAPRNDANRQSTSTSNDVHGFQSFRRGQNNHKKD